VDSKTNKSRNRFKQGMLVVILFLLLAPSFQRRFGFIRSEELKGYFELTPKPEFTIKGFMNGDFQMQYMKNREDSIGFRSDLVRIYNQVDYSLFSLPHAEKVVIGKNDMLFTWNYLMAWLGRGLKGEKYIDEKARKLRFLQDDLWARKKILLLVIFPPEKTYFYPENIPDRYARQKREKGNYQCYVEKCREYGVNNIDVNHWFTSMKDTARLLLYPWNGTHWSDYGALIAADSTVKYIEAKLGKKLPHIVVDKFDMTDVPRHNDNDISRTMNLICNIRDHVMAQPAYHSERDTGTAKPPVLFVGDSFYWGWDDQGLVDSIFTDKQFWYYDKDLFELGCQGTKRVIDQDLVKEIEKREVLIIMHVAGGVGDMGAGFIDRAYAAFDTSSNNKILGFEKKIRSSKEWMEGMEKKSKENNMTLDQTIRADAIYLANEELLKNK
jgi:hypothetical protein